MPDVVPNPGPRLAIWGAGGHGRELAAWAHAAYPEVATVFVDDQASRLGHVVDGVPVLTPGEFAGLPTTIRCVIGVGRSATRRVIAARLVDGPAWQTVVHPGALVAPDAILGPGCVVAPGAIVSVGVTLGEHVHVNVAASISHDCRVGDYATIAPGARLCGNVHVGEAVEVGAGAVIINGSPDAPLTIAPRTVIGAGACVVRSIHQPGVWVGVPARLIRAT